MNQTPEAQQFDEWAIIELFGHQKMAGHVTQAPIGDMLRVDVHESGDKIMYTRLINPKAIYAINPVSMEVAIACGKQMAQPPVTRYEFPQLAAAKTTSQQDQDDPWDEEDYYG